MNEQHKRRGPPLKHGVETTRYQIRMPVDVLAQLRARGEVTAQIVAAIRAYLASAQARGDQAA